jgi:hypothetical protein
MTLTVENIDVGDGHVLVGNDQRIATTARFDVEWNRRHGANIHRDRQPALFLPRSPASPTGG